MSRRLVPYSIPLGDEANGVVVLPVPFMAEDLRRLRLFCDYLSATFAEEMTPPAEVPAADSAPLSPAPHHA